MIPTSMPLLPLAGAGAGAGADAGKWSFDELCWGDKTLIWSFGHFHNGHLLHL